MGRVFPSFGAQMYPAWRDLILGRTRLDLWLDCGIWNEDLVAGGRKTFRMVWPNPKTSEIMLKSKIIETQTQGASMTEWKRKMKAGSIRFSRNVDPLIPLTEDKALDKEGTYEIRYGQRVLFIAVPPPWRASLEIRLCNLWPWFDRWLSKPLDRRI